MSVYLLDVNLLVALAWPNHIHHAAAHEWFDRVASPGWATCPITQCGFIRVSSNKKAIPAAVTPSAAIELLSSMLAERNHVFWPDSLRWDQPELRLTHRLLAGHQQVTDAYLLALAIQNDGVVATFDKGLKSFAGKAAADRVALMG